MKIVDLTPGHHDIYFNCLSDWSEEMLEAGQHKTCWYDKYKDKGLRVKLAVDEEGTVGGMIQYLPIEASTIEGKDLYFILCIWVHGYKEGRGNFQGKGMGQALLEAAEKDALEKGAKGMAAWGLWLPFWMKSSWFKKQGYIKADRDSMAQLVWKPFADDATPPRWIHQKKDVPTTPGKVTVTAFINGWCPAQNMVYERAKRASAEFGDKVVFRSIDTSDRDTFLEWGISDAIFINDKQIAFGPPLSFEKIKHKISRHVSKLT